MFETIVMWNLRKSTTWPQVRNTHVAILRRIENGEIDWETDINTQHHILFEQLEVPAPSSYAASKIKKREGKIWFCKDYQKTDGCPLNTPHVVKISGKDRTVVHICAACWL